MISHIYECRLTLHDNLFFASREMGILYETEKYLHNWALTYAVFSETYIPRPYRMKGPTAQRPGYLDVEHEQNLLQLNSLGLYLFPARPLQWHYQVNTFKAAQVGYYGRSEQFGGKAAKHNYPINFGRAKELAVGSTFCTYLLSEQPLELEQMPAWIRLGKWATKINIRYQEQATVTQKHGKFVCTHPLNPIDMPTNTQLLLYDRVVMPPVSLISQAQLDGGYWRIRAGDDGPNDSSPVVYLPANVAYGASHAAAKIG
ncbi:MAG: type I-D CRISPR-associated protein Cas5/Csc1 [Leptolyngbya sp. SIO4C1]|nr:type I-D CRISPR-associated protein Cas5/Csc1 [Leptolyngbya sp. SIO4C1]